MTHTKRFFDSQQIVQLFPEIIQNDNSPAWELLKRSLNRHKCWREAIEQLLLQTGPDTQLGQAFLNFWFTYGAYSIPKGLKDDLPVVVDVFRHLMPPYRGEGLMLYRGESARRYQKRKFGISWTPNLECAQTFADRNSTTKKSGVILRINALPQMIVLKIRDFSNHTLVLNEDEYLVDPRLIGDEIQRI